MRIVAVIQARMSSSRFPGKMLAPLCGMPLAAFVCRRVSACPDIHGLMLATSEEPSDDALSAAVSEAGFQVYRGSLTDVLGRIKAAAATQHADAVVRVTGDCPLVDPDVLSAMVRRFQVGDIDYLSNVSPPSFPDGLDVEIIRMQALEIAAREATEPHEREHVTPFIRERPGRFASSNFTFDGADLSALHWSVDQPEHLALIVDLIGNSDPTTTRLPDLLAKMEQNPDLRSRSLLVNQSRGAIATFRESMQARAPRPRIEKSDELWRRALPLIPAGTQTLSKGPTQFVRGFAPKYLVRGRGSHVWDADDNEYIDYPMGLGPVTIGHANAEVTEAIVRQLELGNCFSLMHPLEVELAERISRMVPCAEMVRYGKNGSDATSACIRAARTKTGRTHVARHGYHGWQDWSIEASYGVRSKGVPAEVMSLTTPFPYNDLRALEAVLSARPYAAVIMEPMNLTPPKPGYLEGVRELATQYGAVLVFDEVITGFRFARGGAQEYFGVTPDLCAMGKGMANGFPLSIVAGKREFMAPFEEIFFSFTFGGEVSALAAAMATLDIMEREDYWGHVWRQGRKLQEGYRAIAVEFGVTAFTDCNGLPPWTIITFADHDRWTGLELKTLFQQEMIRRGVLFSGSQFLSLSHSDEDIEHTIGAYREAMRVLKFAIEIRGVDQLTEGQVNEVVFRRG